MTPWFSAGVYPEFVAEARLIGEKQKKEAKLIEVRMAPDLFSTMRKAIPKPGEDIHEVFSVVFPSGKYLFGHRHPEWVALFYPEPAETPIVVGDFPEEILPKTGEILVIEPMLLHSVPRNTSGRVRKSIAMKVKA